MRELYLPRMHDPAVYRLQQSRPPTCTSYPGCRLVAWGEDTSGNEKYTLRVRDIATGEG